MVWVRPPWVMAHENVPAGWSIRVIETFGSGFATHVPASVCGGGGGSAFALAGALAAAGAGAPGAAAGRTAVVGMTVVDPAVMGAGVAGVGGGAEASCSSLACVAGSRAE